MTTPGRSNFLSAVDLSWLTGRRLQVVDKQDYSWFFEFDDKGSVTTESNWRLLDKRVVVTSDDHGHKFGLPAPVDAAALIRQKVGDNPVDYVHLDDRTGDLSISFSNGVMLQFLTTSGGYEGWRIGHPIRHPGQLVICLALQRI